jgi:peptide deformylase
MAKPPVDVHELHIIRYPDPRLRKRCAELHRFNAELKAIAARMLELMSEAAGVGLAAPQVGLSIRLFVCRPTDDERVEQVYVNPQLDQFSGTVEVEEGCLCLPGVVGLVQRAQQCRIRALDLEGKAFVRSAEGLLARIWQHEMDHLEGRLIIDRMSPATKIANRRAITYLEEQFHSTGK